MIRVLGRTAGNLIKLQAEDQVDAKELESMGTQLRKLVDEHGKLRILLELTGAVDWQQDSVDVDGGQLELDTRRDIERLAIVADARSADPAARFFGELTDGPMRIFLPDQEQLAWNWLTDVGHAPSHAAH